MATALGSGACTLALGVQLQLHWAPPWTTALLIYLYTFVYTLGSAVIPFVLASEVFLPEVNDLNDVTSNCANKWFPSLEADVLID